LTTTTVKSNTGYSLTQHTAVVSEGSRTLLLVIYTAGHCDATISLFDRCSGEEVETTGPHAAMYALFCALTADQAAPVVAAAPVAGAHYRRPLEAAMTGWDTPFVYPERERDGEMLVMPAARRLRFALGGD
jgi:hypothetical protein